MQGMFPPAPPPGSNLTQQVLDDGARLEAARQCLYATLHLPLRLPYRQSQFSSLLLLPIKLTFPVLLSEVNGNHRCFRVRRSLYIIQVTSRCHRSVAPLTFLRIQQTLLLSPLPKELIPQGLYLPCAGCKEHGL